MLLTIETMITVFKCALAMLDHAIRNVFIRFWPGIERPVVAVRQGKVKGVAANLPNGERYHFFKGIPYAKPPVGVLRFRPPVPLDVFSEPVLNCSSDKSDMAQNHIMFNWLIHGSEDALYLNLYTPTLPAEASTKYPVMVYLHGGCFRHGTASAYVCDPKHIVQQGVIVVTVFFRLGPFGFLCLPNAGISGNAGLKDQLCALRWVHDNIEQFGGDAGNVTLVGLSSGSWSTYLHYLSLNSRKYFHRVICQSGDVCTESIFQIDPENKARKLAELLGCHGKSDQDVLATLTKASARSIVKHQYKVVTPQDQGCPYPMFFSPVIEHEETEDSIITKSPEEILKSFNTLQMPIMTGCTNAEGILALALSQHPLDEYNKHADWLVPRFLRHPKGLDRTIVGEQIKKFYLGDKNFGWENANESCTLMSDYTIVGSSNLSAEWISRYQPNSIQYHYMFTYQGRFNLMRKLFNVASVQGACHGDDMWYMFSPSFLPKLPEDSDECRLRNIFIRLLTNFAKYNDPTPDESTLGFKWVPIAPVEQNSMTFDLDCLELNLPFRMVRNPYPERKEFMRNLIKNYSNLL